MMKKASIYFALFFFIHSISAQTLVQGTIMKTGSTTVTIFGKPNVDLNNKLFEGVNICISVPDQGVNNPTVSITVNHMPTLSWTAIPPIPSVENGRAYYTFIGNDNDVNAPLTWLAGTDNPIIEFKFNGGVGQDLVQLNDLSPDGGVGQQSYWYVQINQTGDITNYDEMFYGPGAVNNSGNSPSYVSTADEVVLPVKLTSFTAQPLNNTDAQLDWTTITELNSSHFEVERSATGQSWKSIGAVAAAGCSQAEQHYSLVDRNVFDPTKLISAKFYYLLKMVNNDGSFEYSQLRQVSFQSRDGLFVGDIFPNPAGQNSSSVYVPVSVMTETDLRIDMYDIQGRIVSSSASQLSKGDYSLSIGTTTLSIGIYTIKLTLQNGSTFLRKLVVQ